MFPLGALLAGRGAANRYIAATDTFCYLLPAADFHALLAKSPKFHDFCTRRIASLLEESQRAVQSEYALALDDESRFARPLASLIRRTPLSSLPVTPLADALAAMEAARVGSVVVTDEAGQPLGILTLKDVLARRDPGRGAAGHPDFGRDRRRIRRPSRSMRRWRMRWC